MIQRRKYWKYLAVAVVIFVVYISRDTQQISGVQGVAGISIDTAGGENYLFGLEVAEPDKSGDFTVNSRVMTVQARNLKEALSQASLRNEYPVVLTHGSLVVLGEEMLKQDLNEISKMLLTEWSGQTETYLAVAQGSGVSILQHETGANLRSGLLSQQLFRAKEKGVINGEPMHRSLSAYLGGENVSLPLVMVKEQGYGVVGSVTVGGVHERI